MPETPYAASPADQIDKVPRTLRPDVRHAECAKCGSPVILYRPSFAKTEAVVKSRGHELVIVCHACLAKFETKAVVYREVWLSDPQVSQAFHKAAAELN